MRHFPHTTNSKVKRQKILNLSCWISDKICPGNGKCSGNGICDAQTGICNCSTGFYGLGCESKFTVLAMYSEM